jgi:hypothetical protein
MPTSLTFRFIASVARPVHDFMRVSRRKFTRGEHSGNSHICE